MALITLLSLPSLILVFFLPSSLPLSFFPNSSSPSFLDEIVKAVSDSERWGPDAAVRLYDLDAAGARVAATQRYEFRARAGMRTLALGFPDGPVDWQRSGEGAAAALVVESGPDLVAGDGAVGYRSAVRDLELVGPLDLRVRGGGGGGRISLRLPSSNATHTGLKRIFVPDGITIKLVGAREISITHPHDIGLLTNGSFAAYNEEHTWIRPLGYPSCIPLLSVQVVGPTVAIAHRSRNPSAYVEASFKSLDTMELLPDKCYPGEPQRRPSACPFCPVSARLVLLEKVLTALLGKRSSMRFLNARVTSSTLVKFRLELERDVTHRDRGQKKVPEWKTEPAIQRVWVNVVARVEEGGRLKALVVKKLKRSFVVVESTAWSKLMSNISFTQFSSLVLPPEALTLDVKW